MSTDGPAPFVVGLDGSACSMVALGVARGLAEAVAAPIIAVFVRLHPGTLVVSTIAASAHRLAMESTAAGIEAELLTYLADYPFRWEFETRDGQPERELIAAAEERGACMVIVGHRGHNAMAERFVGSVAAGLVHRCPVSVLVAR